jgi:hypothetical protein
MFLLLGRLADGGSFLISLSYGVVVQAWSDSSIHAQDENRKTTTRVFGRAVSGFLRVETNWLGRRSSEESVLTQVDDLRKSLLEALTACADHTRKLRHLLENLPSSASPHDYANLMCQRVAETHAIKHYLQLQTEFFEMLKAEASLAAEPSQEFAGETEAVNTVPKASSTPSR